MRHGQVTEEMYHNALARLSDVVGERAKLRARNKDLIAALSESDKLMKKGETLHAARLISAALYVAQKEQALAALAVEKAAK